MVDQEVFEQKHVSFVLIHLLDVFLGEFVEQTVEDLDLFLMDGRLVGLLHMLGVEHGPEQEDEVLFEERIDALESIDVAIKAFEEEVALLEPPGLDVAGQVVELRNVLFADLPQDHLVDDVAPLAERGLFGFLIRALLLL